ncbi:PHA/PHB synthase family protein [Cognatiyoonia sp. IB215182]|uniref:PHA/PHB synthase family protein n=1 Tax=Cognatiyoonia sp. IB215182 TaxID=3097353 RepID=UPI002A10D3FB|nr:alpha/beta fold hydrolase [Cognatiyoonia sp. IB215182]MDX8352852.1 alpha/beta fold hydrolase [Cognatiyoonia sp. IB215182]
MGDVQANAKDQHALRKSLARLTAGTSPAATITMWTDWAVHLASAPDKQLTLMRKAQENWLLWTNFVAHGCPSELEARPVRPEGTDRRFRDESWDSAPFAAMAQAFLLMEDFLDAATSDVPGLNPAHDRAMTFLGRQMLDAFAPSNFLATNPEAIARTFETGGFNLVGGASAFWQDIQKRMHDEAPKPTKKVGRDVAVTPGKVVFRNHLIELIQYVPVTDKVHPEPVLIIPAWIMKYYILDLSPENSMIKYLTEQGFTVFAISWRNPDAADAELGMADYLHQGPSAAIDQIADATKARKIHTVGYCLGGTLLSIAAAAMARDGDDRLASMTLLAAQTDFSEAGELMLFINESQVSFLEDIMDAQGYLNANQMMSAFQMLRSNDLIWSQMVRKYLLGDGDAAMNDLMSWNADSTRMPARMHGEYLRQMFLNNDLAAGRYHVDGHGVSLRDIRIPVFGVGTETDHIAPWKSVFKIHNLGHADVTFALTNGGHNAGVVSKPGHPRRHYRLHTIRDQDKALTPEDWFEEASLHEGSWWPAWAAWLSERSGKKINPPKITGALEDAPGSYVKME